MENIESVVFVGGMDSDSALENVATSDVIELQFCRLGEATGQGFNIVTSQGTIQIVNPAITDDKTVIGTCKWIDESNGILAIIYFLHSEVGSHQIWYYDVINELHGLIQISNAFNFNKSFPITHASVVGKNLKWTDARWNDALYDINGNKLFNEPKQIGIGINYLTIDEQTCSAIKWPLTEPNCKYVSDTTRHDNKIRNKLFKFRTQAIYETNQKSAWSHYSNLALPKRAEFLSGVNFIDDQQDNGIDITFFTGPNCVKFINIGVESLSDSTNGVASPLGIFKQYKKIGDGSDDNIYVTIRYFGDAAEATAIDADKSYDRLPRWAACQSLLPTNQVAYTNFREGFDKIEIDCAVSSVQKEIYHRPNFKYFNTGVNGGNFVINFIGVTVNFPDQLIENGFLFTEGDCFSITENGNVRYYYVTWEDIQYCLDTFPSDIDKNRWMYAKICDGIFSFLGIGGMFPPLLIDNGAFYSYELNGTTSINITGRVVFTRRSNARPSLKTGADHVFGIEYYDEAERPSTVITNDDLRLNVPFPPKDTTRYLLANSDHAYTTHPKFTINHVPPIDASHYRIFALEKTNILDFQQTTILDIVPDGSMYKISLDNFYVQNFQGATINHQIQKGDIVRFLRKRVDGVLNPPLNGYLSDYFETQVLKYAEIDGTNGYFSGIPQAIWVDKFDVALIGMDANMICGQLVEIYTPRPTMDDNELFLSGWRAISEKIEIGNKHLPTRYHKVANQVSGDYAEWTGDYFKVYPSPNLSSYVGLNILFFNTGTEEYVYGEIETCFYDSESSVNYITLVGGLTGTNYDLWQINNDQLVIGGSYVLPAQFKLDWGDIYLKQRLLGSSFTNPAQQFLHSFYQYVEDPHFSDYWLSKYISNGVYSFESKHSKLLHRKASTIHSDSFIDNSQLDGTSSFGFDLDRVQDMTDDFGEVRATLVDGETFKLFQPLKENSIYIRNIPQYAENVGESPILLGKTFARWRPYNNSTYGCSDFKGVVIVQGIGSFYWDRLSKSFILSATNGQVNLSDKYLYRKKSEEIAKLYEESPGMYVRSFVNEKMGEVCWAFNYDKKYLIVHFDYKRFRFRSVYSYDFLEFENVKNHLVGFNDKSFLFVHNREGSFTFHGKAFTEKIIFASNDHRERVKRYMDMKIFSNKKFDIKVKTEANVSYPAMETNMTQQMISHYEGILCVEYRKNKFTPNFATQDLAQLEGEEIRARAARHELSRVVDSESITSMVQIRTV